VIKNRRTCENLIEINIEYYFLFGSTRIHNMYCFQLFQRIGKHNMPIQNLTETERSWHLQQISEAIQYLGHILLGSP
jgi:hypothetical protein